MRTLKWIGVVAAVAALVATGTPGRARAAALSFQGSIAVAIANLPPIAVSGAGVAQAAGAGTALGGLALPQGIFGASVSVPVTDPLAFPLAGVKANPSNGPGSFLGSPLGGLMPILGSATICLFEACNGSPVANIQVPFTGNGTRGVGLGGAPIVVAGLVSVTLQGAPWTTGVASAASASVAGFAHGPASGGLETVAQASGALRLVTPITVQTSIGGSPLLPAFGILTLHFVPEPGSLLLLAGGVAALGLLGRGRGRR